MIFLPETRERFLRAIVAQVAPERVIEIYFFAPIRQGGVESGVAVIAAEPEALAAEPGAREAAQDAPHAGPAEVVSDGLADAIAPGAAAPDALSSELVDDAPAGVEPDGMEPDGEVVVQQEIFIEPETGARAAAGVLLADARGSAGRAAAAAPAVRYTVCTAKYRLVLKGLDRGRWESGVVAEADAPLLTVEAVVRGVQRRSGDTDEPERMSGDEVREWGVGRSLDGGGSEGGGAEGTGRG